MDRQSSKAKVEFKYHKSIDKLKQLQAVNINTNHRLSVAWLRDDIFHPFFWKVDKSKSNEKCDKLLESPAQNAPDHMLNALNDECFFEIFMVSQLTALDLFEIANVCTRFRRIAKQAFGTKFKTIGDFYQTIIPQPLWRIEQFFAIFGSSITVLDCVPSFEPIDTICGIIFKHCPNIRELKCSIQEQQTIDDREFCSLVGRLKTLHLDFYRSKRSFEMNPMNLAQLLHATESIEALSLNGHTCRLIPVLKKLHKLVTFKLFCAPYLPKFENESFFTHNSQIQKLSFINVFFRFDISTIFASLSNITDLELTYVTGTLNCKDYSCFGQLKCLRTLSLCNEIDQNMIKWILNAIALHKVPIESLIVRGVHNYDEDIVGAIGKIRTIKRLEIADVHKDCQLMCIAQELLDIEEIDICSYSDAPVLKGIGKMMVNGCSKLKKINYAYKVHPEHANIPLYEMELTTIWETARERGIDLKMTIYSSCMKVSDSRFVTISNILHCVYFLHFVNFYHIL